MIYLDHNSNGTWKEAIVDHIYFGNVTASLCADRNNCVYEEGFACSVAGIMNGDLLQPVVRYFSCRVGPKNYRDNLCLPFRSKDERS